MNELTRQPTSAMCFVCGRENPVGLHMHFFADELNQIHAEFTPREEHQGFPGIIHGGLISALFDETIGRTAMANDFWSVTAELTVCYKKLIPIGELLKIIGKVEKTTARVLHGRGEILSLRDNILLAEAEGVYVRISDERRLEVERNRALDRRVVKP